MTNSVSDRLTIVAFTHLHKDELIAPLNALTDEEQQPLFRGFKFEENTESFFGGTLTRKSALEPFKLSQDVAQLLGSRELRYWIKNNICENY